MRVFALVTIVLLAGCSDAPADPAPDEPAAPDVEPLPEEIASVTIEIPPPTISEFELSDMCSAYAGGIYSHACPDGTTVVDKENFFEEIPVGDAVVMVVEATLTEGNPGQLLVRDRPGTWLHREDLRDTIRFEIDDSVWGDLDTVTFEIAGAMLYSVAGAEVWASGPIAADVTVSAFSVTPADLAEYCAQC